MPYILPMKRLCSVVFLVLISLKAYAIDLAAAIDGIEKEWATAYYDSAQPNPSAIYQKLLAEAQALERQSPKQAEPLLWQAILAATDADHQPPIKALEQINFAHDLLLRTIALDPDGVGGSAQVTLGTLYFMAPSWPIAFGDKEKAEQYFLSALKINPNSIEANYFYGDFLLSQQKTTKAENYFKKALTSPTRINQPFADKSLQQKAAKALNNAQASILNQSKKIILSNISPP